MRYPWAQEYRGQAMVVYGHTPVPRAEWVNNTICLDTGVVFGGELTALRYPERDIVSVPAEQEWYEPVRPLAPAVGDREQSVLKIDDVAGTRWLETTHAGKVKIPEENAAAALEIMSRFAVDPRWLIYLPPTMSPATTSKLDGFLEHPEQAFEEYAGWGVARLVCEENKSVIWETPSPVAVGSRMTLRNRGNPSGFSKMTAPLMELAMRRATTKDLARLKAFLER